jgi:hypothetical protein
MLLVRPDQHVAWRATDLDEPGSALLRAIGGAADALEGTAERLLESKPGP